MLLEKYVSTLRPGDVFRDWLVYIMDDRISNKRCDVRVYKVAPASHTVCRYEFVGENYGVVAKFYAEPTGCRRDYDPVKSMETEFSALTKTAQVIDVPKPIAMRKDFNCVLVTENIHGNTLYRYMETEKDLYDKLTAVAQILRRLHGGTKSMYRKQEEFAHFHKVLDQLRLDNSTRKKYDRILGDWWYSTLVDLPYGCRIHNDANPANYIFSHDKIYAIDFESSWEHASFIHDLGIMAAELKHYFAIHKNNEEKAEPYIGHFLWQYSKSEEEFHRITKTLPFFMALGFFRMARLGVDRDQNAYIFRKATDCLKAIYLNGKSKRTLSWTQEDL
ncbi:MAG: phosphotransferase [Methanotrichaceae archaeon]